MNTERKIAQLRRLLDKAAGVMVESSSDPSFRAWKNLVERTLIAVFGKDSPEFEQFDRLRFFYSASIMALGADYSTNHRRIFKRDLAILLQAIQSYIEELEESESAETDIEPHGQASLARIFISHSSIDSAIVEELIELIEAIGFPAEAIFCSSFEGYGIDLGENFLEAIRDELRGGTLVLFVLTKNFYSSPTCLCEMGAAWVVGREHIPILVPPFDFSDVKGVIPLTQGFRLNEPLKLNLFKEKLERLFSLQPKLTQSVWERKRDRIIARIEAKV